MKITSNNGGPDAGFNDAAFGIEAAPEPSSLLPAGIGILVLEYSRRYGFKYFARNA